jgi:hypothetical protein
MAALPPRRYDDEREFTKRDVDDAIRRAADYERLILYVFD